MSGGKYKERMPVPPDQFKKHDRRFEWPAFRGRDGYYVIGLDGDAEFILKRFYAEWKPVPCTTCKDERRRTLYKE